MTTLTHYKHHTFTRPLPIFLPPTLTAPEFYTLLTSPTNPKAAFTFPALDNWLSQLLRNFSLQENPSHPFHSHPYALRALDIQAVDWFRRGTPGSEDKLGFMKLQARIETDPYVHEGEEEERVDWIPGAVFLRGGSVAVLIILQPEDSTSDSDKKVLLTVQPRTAAASLSFTELPAGMLDGSTLTGTAAAEIEQEAALKVHESELINLSALALADDESDSNTALADSSSSSLPTNTNPSPNNNTTPTELLQDAIYPSPGACDEFIPLLLCQKRLTKRHMAWLQGRATGLRDEGERIKLKLVPLGRVWREAGRDGKALAAVALYEGLRREGRIGEGPTEVEGEPEEVAKGG